MMPQGERLQAIPPLGEFYTSKELGASWNCQFRPVAERTGLEPATPGLTGRNSNQLNYRSHDGC